MNLKEMNSVEAHFTGNNRTYTYAVDPELPVEVGQRYLTKTPSKGFTYVNILKVHKVSQLDPNAKFEYKELKHLIHILSVEEDGFKYFLATAVGYPGDFVGKSTNEEDAIAALTSQLNS